MLAVPAAPCRATRATTITAMKWQRQQCGSSLSQPLKRHRRRKCSRYLWQWWQNRPTRRHPSHRRRRRRRRRRRHSLFSFRSVSLSSVFLGQSSRRMKTSRSAFISVIRCRSGTMETADLSFVGGLSLVKISSGADEWCSTILILVGATIFCQSASVKVLRSHWTF